jgi:hypothetical protein
MSELDLTDFYRQVCSDERSAIVDGSNTDPRVLACRCGNNMFRVTAHNDEYGTHYIFFCCNCKKKETVSTIQ